MGNKGRSPVPADHSPARDRDAAELHAAMREHQAGRLREAEAIYRRLLAANPQNFDALQLLGLLAHHAGHSEAGAQLMQQALRLRPDATEVWLNLGAALEAAGRLDEARASCERAVALQPEFAAAHRALGRLLHLLGRFDLAAARFRDALALSPLDPDCHTGLAIALRAVGDLDGACASFDAAATLAPQKARAHFDLGNAQRDLGRAEDAEASFRRAIALDPRDARVHYNLGHLLLHQGRRQDADACLRAALELAPDEPAIRYLAGDPGAERAPAAIVRAEFDAYADIFDRHLVQKLKYDMPRILADAARSVLGGVSTPEALDLGCGTGLSGEALRPLARRLTGVDLSERMLDKARARGCYDDLVAMDLVAYLAACRPSRFGLVAACDVFVYIGDLAAIYAEAARVLESGGVFAFSVEAAAEPSAADFRLEHTGRYTHAAAYLRKLAALSGFVVVDIAPTVGREQHGMPVAGWLAILKK